MRKAKVIILLIVVLLAGLFTFIIYVASHIPVNQQKNEFVDKINAKRQGIYNNLGLSDEQRKLLEENRNKHKEQTKALFMQLRQKTDLLRQELEKSALNMQEVYQTNNELKQLQTQMLDNRLERILEVKKILTPGQFKKFEDKVNKNMEHFKNKRKGNKEEF